MPEVRDLIASPSRQNLLLYVDRGQTEEWQREYHEERPHALSVMTPKEFLLT